MEPTTGEVVPNRFNPSSGRPINPLTNEEFPLNGNGIPYNPETGMLYPGTFNPKSGIPVDEKTKEPYPIIMIPPDTMGCKEDRQNWHARKYTPIVTLPGFPIEPQKDSNFQKDTEDSLNKQEDNNTKQEIGKWPSNLEDQRDPKERDPQTWIGDRQPNPPEDRPLFGNNPDAPPSNENAQEPNPFNKPQTNEPQELTRKPYNPYNPANGFPINPDTGKEFEVNDQMKPFDPINNEEFPGKFDPETHTPLDKDDKPVPMIFNTNTGLPVEELGEDCVELRFDPNTGRPLDPLTQIPIPINPETGETEHDHVKMTKFDPITGLRIVKDDEIPPMVARLASILLNPEELEEDSSLLTVPKPKDGPPPSNDNLGKSDPGKIPPKLNPVESEDLSKIPGSRIDPVTGMPIPPEYNNEKVDETKLEFPDGGDEIAQPLKPIPIDPDTAQRDMILTMGDIWSKNPEAAKALCTPETIEALNQVLDDAKIPGKYSPEQREETEDKVHEILRNVLNQLPEEEERAQAIIKPLNLHNILPIVADKIGDIFDGEESITDDPILRTLALQNAEEELDFLNILWNNSPDKSPFIDEKIPEVMIDKLNSLNNNGPEELDKNSMNATTLAQVAKALNPLLQDPVFLKQAVKSGLVPVLQDSLENLRDAQVEEDKPVIPDNLEPKTEEPMVAFSQDPLTYATETCMLAFNTATKNKVVAQNVPIEPEEGEEESTIDHIRDLLAANPLNPIIAAKASETIKNIVINKPSEELRENRPDIDEVVQDIKKVAQLFPVLPAIGECVEEIDNRIDAAQAEVVEAPVLLAGPASYQPKKGNVVEDPLANATPSDLQDIGFLSDQIDRLNDLAQVAPLTPKELNDLEKTCDSIRALVRTDPEVEERSAWNLEIPKKLAELATNPNVAPLHRIEAIEALEEITQTQDVHQKMITDGTVQDTIMDSIKQQAAQPLVPLDPAEEEEQLDLLKKTGELLHKMTDNPDAAERLAKTPDMMNTLVNIMKLHPIDPEIQEITLGCIDNVTKDEKNLEHFEDTMGPDALEDLFKKECDILPILRRTNRCTGNMARDEPSRVHLRNEGCIPFMAWGCGLYPKDLPLAVNTTWAIRRLCRYDYENAKQILDSGVLHHISGCLNINIPHNEFAEHMCHAVINMTYRNDENKRRVEDYSILEKICRIFDHFSKEEDLCQKNVLASLKCFSNMTVLPEHTQTCADCGLIASFDDYFKRHKEPLRTQIMLGVIGNMGYEYNPTVLKSIVDQGAIDILARAIKHFDDLNDAETCCCAVDVLGTIAHNREICKLISEYRIVPPVVRLLKGCDWNQELVYKTTRGLYRICVDDTIKRETIENKGHEVAAMVVGRFWPVNKILFNVCRLLNTLVAIEDTQTLEETTDTGIIDTVVKNFNHEIDDPICIEIFLALTKLAYLDRASDQIGRKFAATAIKHIDMKMHNQRLVKAGADLLAIVSQLYSNVEHLFFGECLPLVDKIFKNWEFEPSIGIPTMQVIAEFAKHSENMRQECLKRKLDDTCEKIMDNIDEYAEPLYHQEAKTDVMLLRGNLNAKKVDPHLKKYLEGEGDLDIPIEVIQFLTSGRTMRYYGEDGNQRTLTLVFSKDLDQCYCKRPNERKVKQKYVMPTNAIKDIKRGYDTKNKEDPFVKGTGFFGKKPEPELCFSLFGPTTKDGQKNFHFRCEDEEEREKFVEWIDLVKRSKKIKKSNALNKKWDE